MRKLKDTDYLYISTRLKVLEKNMLTRDKLSRIASAKTVNDSVKLISEFGWADITGSDFDSVDEIISQKRSAVLDLLYTYCPDRRLIDIFRLKYDYHNVKVYVKSGALGSSYEELYSDDGIIPYKTLIASLRDKRSGDIPKILYDTAKDAEDVLLRTRDPQLADILVDKGHIAHMQATAAELSSDFLNGYISLLTDLSNLRIAVRSLISDKDRSFRSHAFLPSGTVDTSSLVNDNSAENIQKLFSGTLCAGALEAFNNGGDMSAFDRAFDKALMNYIDKAKLIPFGEAQVISYLIKTENEQNSIKTVLTCKSIGMDGEQIMERLIGNDL